MEEALSKIKRIYSREIVSANIIECSAGTTGYCGGDTGHGCRTYLSIEDKAGTDIRVRVTTYDGNVWEFCNMDVNKIEIALGGDCELSTFAKALEFALKKYEEEIKKNEEI